MRTSLARRISVSVLGCLLARWSKKYLTVYNDNCVQRGYIHSENKFVLAWKIEIAKSFERMISVFDICWERTKGDIIWSKYLRNQFCWAAVGGDL